MKNLPQASCAFPIGHALCDQSGLAHERAEKNLLLPPCRGKVGMGVELPGNNASTPSLALPLQGGGEISVNQLTGLKFPILSTPWRELEKIRDTVCSELSWSDFLLKGATLSHQMSWAMCEAQQ